MGWSSVMIVASLSPRGDRGARALGGVGRGPRGPQRGRTTSKVRRVWFVNGTTGSRNPTQAHPPAPRQQRPPHPDERPQPATTPHQVWFVDVCCGHRCAECDDAAGRRRDRGAAGPRGMPRPPTHAGALAHGHARHRSPAAVTASRHLSNISVTVGPLGPSNRPRTTRRMPLLAACSIRFGDGAGPRPECGTGYARVLRCDADGATAPCVRGYASSRRMRWRPNCACILKRCHRTPASDPAWELSRLCGMNWRRRGTGARLSAAAQPRHDLSAGKRRLRPIH